MSQNAVRAPVHLADYRPPDYLIDTVDLDVSLHPTATRVVARLALRPNPRGVPGAPLRLDGDGLKAVRVEVDGAALELGKLDITPDRLVIATPPAGAFSLLLETIVDPTANTQLSGLYRSGSAYCTQCEAEGFRRISYFLDRPDVLAVYTTRIEADKSEAPVLLGNGNPVEHGDIADGGRHFAVWHDPHPKPAYLFALVGGDLGSIHDAFRTRSGRDVKLGIYVEHGNEGRAAYAMDALKRSMKWDEDVFGREYDLDVFNIVAVSDFNMGAMENKGLNVFNDKYVLALPRTATDGDYAGIETVIAHEYFHNWTGNRITCRDWFQLCLKEGLTVFRDQEFSADQRSRAVKRIADVRTLRASQFTEDAGPLAHNVRPETYLEINNFYTPTVYEKGAEVIRALKTFIGAAAFHAGMDLYFHRYDGTAATVEDFIGCFAEASGRDLAQFMRWYQQAGTPVLTARGSHDAATGVYTLDLAQMTPPTPGQPEKLPLVIPVAFGLVGADGKDMALDTPDEHEPGGASAAERASGVFILSEPTRRILFRRVASRPTPSLLRGFSAPARLECEYDADDLLRLLRGDSDLFNRWQAAQTYATRLLMASVASIRAGGAPIEDIRYIDAIGSLLATETRDHAFVAQVIGLPTENDLAREIGKDVDPSAIFAARRALRRAIARRLEHAALTAIESLSATGVAYSPDAASAGRRALKNVLLDLLCAGDGETGLALAERLFEHADNMTDQFGALVALSQTPGGRRERALDMFFRSHAADPLVIDKWFALQAMLPEPDTLARVRELMTHHAFAKTNPNRLRALVGSFANGNPTRFHAEDGSGHDFIAGVVIDLDSSNPQIAARLLGAFRTWRTLEPTRRGHAEASLRRIASIPTLSADTRDIVDRSLG